MEEKIIFTLKSAFQASAIAITAFVLGLIIVKVTGLLTIVDSQLWELSTITGALILLVMGAVLIIMDCLLPFSFILASFSLWTISGTWLFELNGQDPITTTIWCIGVAMYLIVMATSWLLETEH